MAKKKKASKPAKSPSGERKKLLSQLTSVKGIGPATASAIVRVYGLRSIERLTDDPSKVAENVAGLSDRIANLACAQFQRQDAEAAFARRRRRRRIDYLDGEHLKEELAKNWDALYAQRRYVESVLAKHHRRLMSRPDVRGLHVGLARKKPSGGDTEMVVWPLQYCIRVHVAKKSASPLEAYFDTDDCMPRIEGRIEGVRVDVMQQNYTKLVGKIPSSATVLSDPIRGGVPIAPASNPHRWGTLGKVVFTVPGRAKRYLTNAHVVGKVGEQIQQPASDEFDATRVIGRVAKRERSGKIDAAIIEPTGERRAEGDIVGPDEGGELAGLYIDGALTRLDEKFTEVFKVGAATGFEPILAGEVKNIKATVEINGRVMTNQILVEANERIIEPGDSGSVLITRARRNGVLMNVVVGLVHAQTINSAGKLGFGLVASHIHLVKERLQISIN